MSKYICGFIGVGNMGGALASAAAKNSKDIILADVSAQKAADLADALCVASGSNTDVAKEAKFIFLGVKPNMIADLLKSLADTLGAREDRFVLVSMAAGIKIDKITSDLGVSCPIIRIMPNTPVQVGAGLVLYHFNSLVTKDDISEFLAVMKAAGSFEELDEAHFDAGSAVSGCGPAMVDIIIEAISDGGVRAGLPRATAQKYAEIMIKGSATLALETGAHPGVLKDAVCSPGGSTIEAVSTMEEHAVRAALADAVVAAYKKTIELGK